MTALRRFALALALPVVVGNVVAGCDSDDDDTLSRAGSTATGGTSDTGGSSTGGTGGSSKGGSGGSSKGGTGGSSKGGSGGTSARGGTGNTTGGTGGDSGTGAQAGVENGGQVGTGGSATGGKGGSAGTSTSAGTSGTAGTAPGTGGMAGATEAGGAGAGGEGGATTGGCSPAMLTVWNFDASGIYTTLYLTGSGPVQGTTTGYSATEGYTAPGAGVLDATFGAVGEQALVSYYPGEADWSCRTKLHAMVKLHTDTDLSFISGVALGINTNSYSDYTGQYNSAAGWQVDQWYPIELDFFGSGVYNSNPSGPTMSDVGSVAVQIQTTGTPAETIMYVDDIWVE